MHCNALFPRQSVIITKCYRKCNYCSTAHQICSLKRAFISAHCNTLQHTAAHCNTLQHTATHTRVIMKKCNKLHQIHLHKRIRARTNRHIRIQEDISCCVESRTCSPLLYHSISSLYCTTCTKPSQISVSERIFHAVWHVERVHPYFTTEYVLPTLRHAQTLRTYPYPRGYFVLCGI